MNSYPASPIPGHSRLLTLTALLCAGLWLHPIRAADLLPPGHRPVPPGVHALTGAKVAVKPGSTLESATIVIRNGRIESVGRDIQPPADARVWDMKGATIYAGFIDPSLNIGAIKGGAPAAASSQSASFNDLTAGSVNFFGVPSGDRDPGQPGPGSPLASFTPDHRVAKGLTPDPKALLALREIGFTAANVVPDKGVIRGTSAFVALSDAGPNEAILKPDVFQHVVFHEAGGDDRIYPQSLMGVIAAVRQTFMDGRHYLQDHADYLKQPDKRSRPPFNPALEALGPALERKMPVMIEPRGALMTGRAAQVSRELNLDFLILASGQEWRRPDLIKATGGRFIVPVHFPELPKMPDENDWSQVTLDQFRAWDWAPENPALLRRQGLELALTTHEMPDRKLFRKNLRLAIDRGLSEEDALAALTIVPARFCGLERQLGTIEPGKIANLTVVDGNYFDPDSKVREVWIDGRYFPVQPAPAKRATADPAKPEDAKAQQAKADRERKQAELRELQKQRAAGSPLEGRGPIVEPKAVLVQNATIWTSGSAGRMENADLLAIDAKVRAVGRGLAVPEGFSGNVTVVDGRGKHVTPGLIDAHSHAMILGNVNEATLPSTAMVRIGDVVNSESQNIHYQLAGGLTVANLLHGSANPIGGQNAVIKLRDGDAPDALVFDAAPQGIKFALGENVKQSNWGEKFTTRFPQSRMGVPTFIGNRFVAAQRYLREIDDAKRAGGLPPRRDLELEALGEILQGKRWIHCHSYRQDEILAFLRLMESFGVKVATLQHVLEGYKVADEIARHGAGASCFSDWWAFKFEVYDAIAYAGSLMHQRGVLVSFNSDSPDLARRMNLEAAKAVKYGGTPEQEALKFVTINPARQLRIEHRVGSLEPGKDADFAIWSKSPLDSGTVCLETWIDGKKYFDRSRESERAAALEKERTALLEKAKKVAAQSGGKEGGSEAARAAFFRQALEQMRTSVIECQDCQTTGRHQ